MRITLWIVAFAYLMDRFAPAKGATLSVAEAIGTMLFVLILNVLGAVCLAQDIKELRRGD